MRSLRKEIEILVPASWIRLIFLQANRFPPLIDLYLARYPGGTATNVAVTDRGALYHFHQARVRVAIQ